jgi:hypothetical protein
MIETLKMTYICFSVVLQPSKEEEQYPYVYKSASVNMALSYGGRMALPLGTIIHFSQNLTRKPPDMVYLSLSCPKRPILRSGQLCFYHGVGFCLTRRQSYDIAAQILNPEKRSHVAELLKPQPRNRRPPARGLNEDGTLALPTSQASKASPCIPRIWQTSNCISSASAGEAKSSCRDLRMIGSRTKLEMVKR